MYLEYLFTVRLREGVLPLAAACWKQMCKKEKLAHKK